MVIFPDPTTGQAIEMYWASPYVYPDLSDDYDLAYLEIHDVFRDEDGVPAGTFPRTFDTFAEDDEGYGRICLVEQTALGDPIQIYGYPASTGSFNLSVTEGIISSVLEEGFFITSAKVDAGNSGGLAVDRRGCMIGVPSAVLEGTYENLGVIISNALIEDFAVKLEENQQ